MHYAQPAAELARSSMRRPLPRTTSGPRLREGVTVVASVVQAQAPSAVWEEHVL